MNLKSGAQFSCKSMELSFKYTSNYAETSLQGNKLKETQAS